MARNPDQPKGAGGRFVRKEQRPQVRDGKSTGSPIGVDDPNFVYRLFEKPSDPPDGKGRDKRLAELKDMGYVHVVRQPPEEVPLACPGEPKGERGGGRWESGRQKLLREHRARPAEGANLAVEEDGVVEVGGHAGQIVSGHEQGLVLSPQLL